MNAFNIYLITRCDALQCMAITMAVIMGFVVGALWLFYCLKCQDVPVSRRDSNDIADFKAHKTCARRLSYLFSFLLLIAVTVPNTKEAAAVYLIPAIANNQTVQQESSELYQLLKGYLKSVAEPKK